MSAKYFVDFWAYFGEVAHEEFATWAEMKHFIRQLRQGALLDFGCLDKSEAEKLEAA